MTRTSYQRLIRTFLSAQDYLDLPNDELYEELRLRLRAFSKAHHFDHVGEYSANTYLVSDLCDDFKNADQTELDREFDGERRRAERRIRSRDARRLRRAATDRLSELFTPAPPGASEYHSVWTVLADDLDETGTKTELVIRGTAIDGTRRAVGVLVLENGTELAHHRRAARVTDESDTTWYVHVSAWGERKPYDAAKLFAPMFWNLPSPESVARTRAAGKRVYLVTAESVDGPWHIEGEVLGITKLPPG